jgi:hypothetical protein
VSQAEELDTATSTVTSSDTTVDLASLDSDTDGKLSLTGNVTAVTIGEGTGNVEFTVATGALTALSLENTGTIAFNHADVALSIPNPVHAVFGGDVTLAGGISTGAASSTSKITFNGDVTLGDGKTITIAESDTASAVTLKAGKSIYAGAAKLITAATDTAFTAAVDGAVLTFTAASGLALSAQGVAFSGDVVFYGGLTLTAVPATFGGTAYFQDTKKITLTDSASVITLKNGTGKLAVGEPAGTAADVWKQILVADSGADAVLTPAAETTLTFTASGKVLTQGATGDNAHGITLTSGGATLISGSSYVVASAASKIGTLTVTGTLTLGPEVLGDYPDAAKPKLILTGASGSDGAKLTGAGSVVFGNASITGGASGTWQAVATSASITIAAEAITGTGSDAALTGTSNDSAVITLAKGHTAGNAAALIVTNAVIDLATNGAVVFPYVGTTPATLVLKGGAGVEGKLKLEAGTTPNANVNLNDGSHSVTISGTTPVIQGADATDGAVAGLISGGTATPANDATITGKTVSYDVTIKTGATLANSES